MMMIILVILWVCLYCTEQFNSMLDLYIKQIMYFQVNITYMLYLVETCLFYVTLIKPYILMTHAMLFETKKKQSTNYTKCFKNVWFKLCPSQTINE